MDKSIWIIAGLAVVAVIISTQSATAAPNGDLNISSLSDTYGTDSVNRLNAIYAQLLQRGYSDQQILFMLSQILFESGMFTNNGTGGNYGLMNQNNYAGLTNVGGGYASYPSVSAFVDAYTGFMTKNNNPIGAASLSDFNNRLVANGYYTENPTVYYNGLLTYYNILLNA